MRRMVVAAMVSMAAASAQAITIDQLMSVVNVGDARLSPDGERVAYTAIARAEDGRGWNAELWLVGAGETVRLTTNDAWDDQPRWCPDGSARLAFASDRAGANQVHLLELGAGTEPRMLTEHANGVAAFAWSPDGTRIAVIVPGGPGEAARARAQTGADVRIEGELLGSSRIVIVDVAGGAPRELPVPAELSATTLDWSPDGTRLAITSQGTQGTVGFFLATDIHVVDVETGTATPIVVREGLDFNPKWSPDGRSLAFLSHDGIRDWIGSCYVCVVPVDGSAPARNVSREFDERDYDAEWHWSADSRAIYLVAPRGVTRHLYALDVTGGKATRITEGTAVHGAVSFSRDGSRMAFVRTTATEPSEIHVATVKPFKPRPVTKLNAHLAERDLGREEVVRWKSFDGLEIEGLVVMPRTRAPRTALPLVVVIHGGPSTPCTASFGPQTGALAFPQGEFNAHVFTSRGYAVFMPNFRGTGGYGRDFLRANVGDWGGGDFKDVMTGIDMLVETGVADPRRLAIVGWSYGGTLASFAITQTPRFKAAVVGAGVVNHVSQYGTTDIPPMIETYMGGPPWTVPDTYRRCSSISHAARVTTPTLLCYGENDARVPPAQGREFYRALVGNGVPAELVIYPRSDHFIFEPVLEMDFQQRMLAWLDRWVMGEEPRPGAAGRKATD